MKGFLLQHIYGSESLSIKPQTNSNKWESWWILLTSGQTVWGLTCVGGCFVCLYCNSYISGTYVTFKSVLHMTFFLLLNYLFTAPYVIHWSMCVSHHLSRGAEVEQKTWKGIDTIVVHILCCWCCGSSLHQLCLNQILDGDVRWGRGIPLQNTCPTGYNGGCGLFSVWWVKSIEFLYRQEGVWVVLWAQWPVKSQYSTLTFCIFNSDM